MSAVSSGSPQGNAEVREPEASQEPGPSRQPVSAPHRGNGPDPTGPADFGANEWLVEELYQRYLADPGSVDRAWWSFFADYQPTLGNGTGPQPILKAAPAPAPSAPAPAVPASPARPPAARPQPQPSQSQPSQPQAPAAATPASAPQAAPAPAPAPAAAPPA